MCATEFCDPIPLAFKSLENTIIRNQRTQFAVLYVILLSMLSDADVLLQVGQLTYLAKPRAGLRQNNNLISGLRRNILSATMCLDWTWGPYNIFSSGYQGLLYGNKAEGA
jgi:hypothetical protein